MKYSLTPAKLLLSVTPIIAIVLFEVAFLIFFNNTEGMLGIIILLPKSMALYLLANTQSVFYTVQCIIIPFAVVIGLIIAYIIVIYYLEDN